MSIRKPPTVSPTCVTPTKNELDAMVYRFTPKNNKQAVAQKLFQTNDVLFLLGPAATGKSFVAIALALGDIKRVDTPRKQLLVIRPHIECGPVSLGFRPGSLADKMAPFRRAIDELVSKIAFNVPESLLQFEPPDFERGRTWDDKVIVIDEAQNLSLGQLTMLITRLGPRSRVIFCGDYLQTDLNRVTCPDKDYDCDLAYFVDRLEPIKGVGVIEFTEIEAINRHPLIPKIVKALA